MAALDTIVRNLVITGTDPATLIPEPGHGMLATLAEGSTVYNPAASDVTLTIEKYVELDPLGVVTYPKLPDGFILPAGGILEISDVTVAPGQILRASVAAAITDPADYLRVDLVYGLWSANLAGRFQPERNRNERTVQ